MTIPSIQRLLASLFPVQQEVSKPTSSADMLSPLQESQRVYCSMRFALTQWRQETAPVSSRRPPSVSSDSADLSSDPDTLDDFLVTIGHEA